MLVNRSTVFTIAICSVLLLLQTPVQAGVTFYTNEAAWRAAVSGEEDFNFTAPNVAKADEVPSPPGTNAQLGGTLTFQAANTGLSSGFELKTLQPGAGFTFNDIEGAEGTAEFNDALSVGDITDFENDDWQAIFSSNSVFAFGWYLVDNATSSHESFNVYDSSDTLLASLTTIPLSENTSAFIGVLSTTAIKRVAFDEWEGGDDIAIGGISLSTDPMPEPTALAVWGTLGGLGLITARRRKRTA